MGDRWSDLFRELAAEWELEQEAASSGRLERERGINAMGDAGRTETRRMLAASAELKAGRPEFLRAIERFRSGASPQ